MKGKLKIGFLISDELVPQWEYDLVYKVLNSEYAGIELLIFSDQENVRHDKSRPAGFIFRLHNKLDSLLFPGKDNFAVKKNILELTGDVRRVKLENTKDRESMGKTNSAFAEIRDLGLDVIIKLGYGRIDEELAAMSNYGLWTFPMTACDTESADTTGYYEVIEKNPVTVSGLNVIMGMGQKPVALARVTESTCSYSISLNREKLYRRASLFVPRILKGIWNYGPSYFQGIVNKSEIQDIALTPPLTPPSFLESTGNLFKAVLILLQQILKKIVYTDPFTWTLLYQLEGDKDFETCSFKDFKKLIPPGDRFWADPFVLKSGDRYFIFVEEFIYKANKGHISILEMDLNGCLLGTGKIIENPYHMSYPFVFESNGVCFMIPETGGNRSIDLYRCNEFPWKWEFVKSIMKDINAVDTTLFRYEGKWWLFTLIDKINSSLAVSPELYLFYADDFLADNWISHPMNPIVTDVRLARPAGKVFIRDGIVYRPSQDCSGRYG
ncbi:MAG TPA: hypothetical protein PK727_10765, partial [Bacteroidales bacterium]|nr:hypothetical protein [Bacteroidales bacterium]